MRRRDATRRKKNFSNLKSINIYVTAGGVGSLLCTNSIPLLKRARRRPCTLACALPSHFTHFLSSTSAGLLFHIYIMCIWYMYDVRAIVIFRMQSHIFFNFANTLIENENRNFYKMCLILI